MSSPQVMYHFSIEFLELAVTSAEEVNQNICNYCHGQ